MILGNSISFFDAKKEPPKTSCEVLAVTKNRVLTLYYSAIHNAFNVLDDFTEDDVLYHAIDVLYWAPLHGEVLQ